MAQEDKRGNGFQSDERTLKSGGAVTRGDRSSSDSERTDKDGTALSKPERVRSFRNEWVQEALPTPPQISGYHLCWVSTTNSMDPVHSRVRMGYEPVRSEEVPGFDAFRTKAGEFEGFISCNEMILMKLPEEVYQQFMSEMHHEAPNDLEEGLSASALMHQTDSNGRQLGEIIGDGFANLGKSRQPHFS